ncbi:MAG: hypothetical protein ACRDN0_21005, partial [Trebonia sp.]
TAMRKALTAAIGAARPGATAAVLHDAARPALGELPGGATAQVRWTHQADMATGGEYASYPADLSLTTGAAVVITVDTVFPDGRHAQVADTVAITPGGAGPITGPITEPKLEAAR